MQLLVYVSNIIGLFSLYNLVPVMAKQATIFTFFLVITYTLTHKHPVKTLSKKSKTGDGIDKNIVVCLVSVHNIISLSLHEQINKYV